ncbi:MAG: tetratricopeptide repeat protein [Planctomycetota bacterium]|nr:tetratricopeptide repeat protein [Planctomycetota bacterium]
MPAQPPHILGQASQLARQGRAGEAIALLRRAMTKDPGDPQLPHLLAQLLTGTGQPEQSSYLLGRASELYEASLRRTGANVPDLVGLADVRMSLKDPAGAEDAWRRAIALDPAHPAPRSQLANALLMLGRGNESAALLREGLARRPNDAALLGLFCSASNYADDLAPEEVFAAHRALGELMAQRAARSVPPLPARTLSPADADRPLTIGYVSGDLREHSVAHFAEPLLRHADRAMFRVKIYDTYTGVRKPDARRDRLRALAPDWTEAFALNDAQLVQKIRADGVDVLMDLSGLTGSSRVEIFAAGPAPLQGTYCGYPNTTGLRAIDLRFTDGLADPVGQTDRFHVEHLVRLDPCFLAYTPPEHAPEPAARDDAAPITFGSFNAAAKLTPTTLDLWAQTVLAVPGSRLLVKAMALQSDELRRPLEKALEARGLSGRFEVLGRVPDPRDHLNTYARVDIGLDTFPYHGTTTTCEALWMGVPVVSLVGATHASRVGLSLLSAAGLSDLAATTRESFVERARGLAQDAPRRAELRRTLRETLRTGVLCDGAGLARRFEAAVREAWRARCGGGSTGGANPAGAPSR